MGKIVPFPLHARASSSLRAAKTAKTSSVISVLPSTLPSATTAAQCGAGMPRVCQPLTVESDWSNALATAPVPPKATMIDFQESIEPNIVRTLRTSQGFAKSETTFSHKYAAMEPVMDSTATIARRLKALRKELGFKSQKAFADKLNMAKSTYNPFETGERTLTFEAACTIRRKFGVPVDWLFFGDLPQIRTDILINVQTEPEPKVRGKRTSNHK